MLAKQGTEFSLMKSSVSNVRKNSFNAFLPSKEQKSNQEVIIFLIQLRSFFRISNTNYYTMNPSIERV